MLTLDHVQIAIPPDREADARAFWGGLLGLEEIAKPRELAGRGGCWFELGDRELHLGVEADFRPAKKAHIALASADLPGLRTKLEAAGCTIRPDSSTHGRERVFTDDPFGNRLELIALEATR